MNSETQTAPADTWAIVELMGHVRLAGKLTSQEHFGVKLGRLDIPTADGGFVTKLFGGASVYAITYVEEAAARIVAARNQEQPVHSWEMPKQIAAPVSARHAADDGEQKRDPDDDIRW